MIGKLDLYKVFTEVVRNQSFSKAAKELYMTQPAVSQGIKQLEKELQIRLFTRTAKGVTLTNEAHILFEYVSSAINLINVGEKKLLESKDLMTGELKIGVGDTISKYYLLPYLEKFHNLSPNIKLKIMNRTTMELINMTKSGEVDLAICNLPIKDPAIEVKKIIDIHDIFVCGDKFKHLTKEPMNIEVLLKHPLIFLEPKSNSRNYVEKYLLTKGIKIKPEIELGSHDLLLEFAKINLGIACVVKEFSQEYLNTGLVHKIHLNKSIPKRGMGVCYLKSVSLSPASKRFIEILEESHTA
ncbi:LysR family transcriptional regulator [Serpentinicella alkaliphila]|uniref:DNA-binding transcriptional LysR family regulator n=1 Tax=Serpentinicella alkaliphila TaxID=1734049 RepID=A0A4V2T4Y7_9FIRM|nr:LysR family transcriptional regulator [Serpentinicella alkaliphila]QUH25263.1 LysR family transcriptional regulator [Serpentinicella alkaliphila]TCQ07074.1 DNA-binding transcriptional LysR family regulator [Serpentinicella alkaliphila]